MAYLKFKAYRLLLIQISLLGALYLSFPVIAQESLIQFDVAYELRSIKGVTDQNKPESFFIRLENGQVDLNPFFVRANSLLEQSNRENASFIERDLGSILDYSNELCGELPERSQIQACQSNVGLRIESQKAQMLERQAERVLFSRFYDRVTVPSQNEVDKVANRIHDYYINRGGCRANYCLNNDIMDTLLYGSSMHYNQVLDVLNEAGFTKECLKHVLEEIAADYWIDPFSGMPKTCGGLNGSDQRVCRQMQSDFRRVTNRIENMVKEIQPTKEADVNVSLSCSTSNDLMQNLTNVLSEIEERSCTNYSEGEQRLPQQTASYSGFYSVEKESNGNYTVTIPIIFSPADDYDGDVPEDQINAHYLERTRTCMDEASPHMLGPNGERLNFNIVDGSSLDASSCQQPNKISIQSTGTRSNADSYAADISCSSTTHELGHEMGLADEYAEITKGRNVIVLNGSIEQEGQSITETFLPNYNCRVIQNNSLMANHRERFGSVQDEHNDSLLDPTHFQVILYGTACQSRGDINLYQKCASLAYETLYKPNSEEDNCPEIKQQCERSNILGRDLERDIEKLEAQLKEKLDQIFFMNNQGLSNFLGNESLSHILRRATEKTRANPGILTRNLFTIQELRDIENTLDPGLYNGFKMFLNQRDRSLIEVKHLRLDLRRSRSLP